MTHDQLAQLIVILTAAKVKRYKTKFIEIEFGAPSATVPVISPPTQAPQPSTSPEPAPEQAQAHEVMSYDQILHWSSSPDPLPPDKETLPMTGDVQL